MKMLKYKTEFSTSRIERGYSLGLPIARLFFLMYTQNGTKRRKKTNNKEFFTFCVNMQKKDRKKDSVDRVFHVPYRT